ncbi:putative polysaccharide biosynthesis protein [Anaeromicropila populeti]|uniref:Stage V sporulation protein B n=1 Tax=Anaeromicropila populeti TaxID=37658 RepID=A0A1I6KYC7_9FIRM|nr:polysaccharide biosynthesis protein [Anaeromicropila populeti]SFR96215.1 stage V sporulation protein B [Anaeromicropila populeti]
MGSSKKANNYLVQGTILAVASILVRFIGIMYRIPMTNILGSEGNGIYTVAFNIYNIVLILSSYSLPLAVSKMVATRSVKKEYRNAHKIFRSALLFSVVVGGLACSILYFSADYLEAVYKTPGVARPLRVLAPTVFVVAVLGVFRGLFQGKKTMIPTAFSQILEQVVNAFVSVYASYAFMKSHSASEEISAYGAAGGTLGTLMGALTALVFVLLVYILYRPTLKRQRKRDKTSHSESTLEIYKIMIFTIIPVVLSQTVYQISGTLDDVIFGNVMSAKGISKLLTTDLRGVYGSQYRVLISLPIAISSAVASSLVPSVVSAMELRDYKDVKDKVRSSIKFNMIVAFPSAAGLAVLAHPIMQLLFPSLQNYSQLAGNLLVTGSTAVIFYALSTTTSAILQGINKMRLPVIHSAVSLVIHVFLVFALLQFTNVRVYALIVGNITFPLVVCILNGISVSKELKYKQEIKKTFLVPLLSSSIMGIIAFGSYLFFEHITGSNLLGVLVSITLSIVSYFICILLFKCFDKEELLDMPLGRTIARIAEKMKLL